MNPDVPSSPQRCLSFLDVSFSSCRERMVWFCPGGNDNNSSQFLSTGAQARHSPQHPMRTCRFNPHNGPRTHTQVMCSPAASTHRQHVLGRQELPSRVNPSLEWPPTPISLPPCRPARIYRGSGEAHPRTDQEALWPLKLLVFHYQVTTTSVIMFL